MQDKPKISSKVDGNIFAVVAAADKALKKVGMADKSKEMQDKVFASENYHLALAVIMEYVDFV